MWGPVVWTALLAAAVVAESDYNLAGRPGEGYVLEAMIGHPPQKLNVLIDTGSSNFAVAGAPSANIATHFRREESTSLVELRTAVSVLYTQGSWSGHLASDFVFFPALNSVPEVRCDIAFITEAENFYMNGSNWQGILGVAYPAISRPNDRVLSWIDSLQQTNKDKSMAFSLTLCGPRDTSPNEHYGSIEILNNVPHSMPGVLSTPVVRDWYYEVVLTGLAVGGAPLALDCRDLNAERTIVDSGTTNIRLPREIFLQVAAAVRSSAAAAAASLPGGDGFWTGGEAACRARAADLDRLPALTLQLLHSDREYFEIRLPGASYVRRVPPARRGGGGGGGGGEYCYKFAVEPSAGGSVLGVAAMEGLEVIFNRTGRTVGFRESPCGPRASLAGPYAAGGGVAGLRARCSPPPPPPPPAPLELAAYAVSALLAAASAVFLYLLLQWLRDKYFRCAAGRASHTSLIDEDQ